MSWVTVRLADCPATAWRNGGGTTRELAAWPTPGNWRWRMSVATIEASGPFSRYDGVRRWFAVLSGTGVRLNIDGVPHTLTPFDAPIAFDGAAATACELIEGTTQDFNLMISAELHSSAMRVTHTVEAAIAQPSTIAVYAIDRADITVAGEATLAAEPGTLVWRQANAATHVSIRSSNSLWLEINE